MKPLKKKKNGFGCELCHDWEHVNLVIKCPDCVREGQSELEQLRQLFYYTKMLIGQKKIKKTRRLTELVNKIHESTVYSSVYSMNYGKNK